MKLAKKVIAMVLVAVMVLTTANFSGVEVSAATKVKVRNGKSKTLVVGDSSKIVINLNTSQVKFTSSAKKVATVSKKGVIKAVAPGKATITIKAKKGKSKATVKVTVLPKNVTNVVATESGANSAKVTWKSQKNVTGYQIYMSTKVNGGYKLKTKVKGASKKSCTIKNLAGGNTYYFKVKAYKTVSGKKITSESLSAHNKEANKRATKQYKNSATFYKLVWSDEFNGTSLDMSTWTFETGNGQDGWGNQEYQSYTAGDNVAVTGGNLVITPRVKINNTTGDKEITSTRIISRGKKQFKYGKIEIRAKATGAHGTWSAGWMLGTNGTWPNNGEIDIFESMMGNVPQTIHCPYFNNQSWSHGNMNFNTGVTQAQSASAFHIYGITWTDTYIQFTVDGKVTGTYMPSVAYRAPVSQTWNCFKSPFYFIFNCAVGGNAALGKNEQIDYSTWTNKGTVNNVTTYEDYMYVDYVRVYQ